MLFQTRGMKLYLLGLLLAWTPTALAGTNIIFAKDGTQATVLMLAISTNPDAVAFNDAIAMAPADNNGKAVKQFAFVENSGAKGLDAICAFSKLVSVTGSCTIVFHAEGKSVIDATHNTITYNLEGDEAARLAAFFILPAGGSGEVFRSSDNHFLLTVESADGAVSAMHLQYGNKL